MFDDLDNYEAVARIVVIGVGGAGNNAVNRMIDEEISSVEFYVANTDRQALATSKARNRLVLGEELTGGLGAGGEPSVGVHLVDRLLVEEIVARRYRQQQAHSHYYIIQCFHFFACFVVVRMLR